MPSAPEGGLIKREWLNAWRLPVAPTGAIKTVVGVDPSDSGSGDVCGLIAASLTAEGLIALIADVSEPLTSEQRARRAVELASVPEPARSPASRSPPGQRIRLS